MTEEGWTKTIYEKVIAWALDLDPASCQREIEKLQAKHPDASAREIAERVVQRYALLGLAEGALTGLFANPVTAIPVGIVDAGFLMRASARMGGVTGGLADAEYLSRDDWKAEVMTIVGDKPVATQTSRRAAIGVVNRMGTRFLARTAGARAVPIIGSIVGGAWNYMELRTLGRSFVRYHFDQEMPPPRHVDLESSTTHTPAALSATEVTLDTVIIESSSTPEPVPVARPKASETKPKAKAKASEPKPKPSETKPKAKASERHTANPSKSKSTESAPTDAGSDTETIAAEASSAEASSAEASSAKVSPSKRRTRRAAKEPSPASASDATAEKAADGTVDTSSEASTTPPPAKPKRTRSAVNRRRPSDEDSGE